MTDPKGTPETPLLPLAEAVRDHAKAFKKTETFFEKFWKISLGVAPLAIAYAANNAGNLHHDASIVHSLAMQQVQLATGVAMLDADLRQRERLQTIGVKQAEASVVATLIPLLSQNQNPVATEAAYVALRHLVNGPDLAAEMCAAIHSAGCLKGLDADVAKLRVHVDGDAEAKQELDRLARATETATLDAMAEHRATPNQTAPQSDVRTSTGDQTKDDWGVVIASDATWEASERTRESPGVKKLAALLDGTEALEGRRKGRWYTTVITGVADKERASALAKLARAHVGYGSMLTVMTEWCPIGVLDEVAPGRPPRLSCAKK